MSTLEALTILSNGGKVRRKCWKYLDYITLNTSGVIVDRSGRVCPIQLTRLHTDWEEVK